VRGLKQQDRGRNGFVRLCPALGAVVGPAETAGGLRTGLPMAPAGAALTSSDWVPTLPRRWRVGCRADEAGEGCAGLGSDLLDNSDLMLSTISTLLVAIDRAISQANAQAP